MNTNTLTSYWTEFEIVALRGVNDFHRMADVGLLLLERMQRADDRPIVQICGPMSTGGKGSLAANMAFFKKTVRVAIEQGAHVFDQTPFEESIVRLAVEHDARREYCKDILHIFYKRLFQSGRMEGLLFLPDWQSSVGAQWEHEEAQRIGLRVENYPAEWLALIEE